MKTTIEVKKTTARRLQIAKHILGHSSADQTINSLLDIAKQIEVKKNE